MVPLLLPPRACLPTSCRYLGRMGAQEQIAEGPGSPLSMGYRCVRNNHDLLVRVLSQCSDEYTRKDLVDRNVWMLWPYL